MSLLEDICKHPHTQQRLTNIYIRVCREHSSLKKKKKKVQQTRERQTEISDMHPNLHKR